MKTKFLMLIACVALLATACKQNPKADDPVAAEQEAQAEAEWLNADWTSQEKGADLQLHATYLTGESQLSRSVFEAVRAQLDDACRKIDENLRVHFQGDTCTVPNLLAYYGPRMATAMKAAWEDIYREVDTTGVADFTVNFTMSVMTNNDRVLTLGSAYSDFWGGNHGSVFENAITLRKADGQPLKQVVNRDSIAALQPLLRHGLGEYLRNHPNYPTIKDSEVEKALFLNGKDYIPLPKSEPAIIDNGVQFIYGEYEIGAHAIGRPKFVVPLDDIFALLTPEARQTLVATDSLTTENR